MKFAGTVLAGKNKGDVIELNAEEKATEALKFVITQNPEISGERPFEGRHVFAREVTLVNVESSLNGELLGKQGFQNNIYRSSGRATLQERDLHADRLLPPRAITFEMSFKDVLQENGLPDLEITHFEFQKE